MNMQDKDLLFDKLLTGHMSRINSHQDEELLFSMILESDVYKKHYEEVAGLNTLLHLPYFKSNQNKDYLLLKDKLQYKNKGKRITWYGMFTKVAAAAAILIVVSLGSIYLYRETVEKNSTFKQMEVSTPLGGQTRLLLPDGSVAWINAKSELKYGDGFGKTDRRLYLEGEGYFEVVKNEQIPFSVHAYDMEVIATGTIFNVRSYKEDNEWEVDLLEGGVDILVANKRYTLHSDEKAIYNKASALVTVESVDAHLTARWIKGKLAFYQASIPDICKMLERHFNVRIRIDSEELKEEYFLGSINLEMSLSEILNYLDVNKKYKIELKDDVIILKNRR
ncbi:MAG: FecR family protein [Dysgonamonadaceae bacterium]|jgi:ferric-dicitrate binding protein FerR (iron transport regulator)|nr:FecR family protein [Dysgonamonadaceae bacterium]